MWPFLEIQIKDFPHGTIRDWRCDWYVIVLLQTIAITTSYCVISILYKGTRVIYRFGHLEYINLL
jgi:hypothetical protein